MPTDDRLRASLLGRWRRHTDYKCDKQDHLRRMSNSPTRWRVHALLLCFLRFGFSAFRLPFGIGGVFSNAVTVSRKSCVSFTWGCRFFIAD